MPVPIYEADAKIEGDLDAEAKIVNIFEVCEVEVKHEPCSCFEVRISKFFDILLHFLLYN